MRLDCIRFPVDNAHSAGDTGDDGIRNTRRKVWHMAQASLARKLRILRAERGLSQHDAAALIGVTPETLGKLEKGQRRAYTPTLTKFARGYGIPVEELMDLAYEDQPSPLVEAES